MHVYELLLCLRARMHGPRELQQTWTTGADVALRVWSLLGAAVAENSVKSEALRLQLITNNAIELPPARSLLHTPLLDLSHATPATQPLHPKLEPWGPPVFVHRLQVPSPRRLSATRATGVSRSSCLPQLDLCCLQWTRIAEQKWKPQVAVTLTRKLPAR